MLWPSLISLKGSKPGKDSLRKGEDTVESSADWKERARIGEQTKAIGGLSVFGSPETPPKNFVIRVRNSTQTSRFPDGATKGVYCRTTWGSEHVQLTGSSRFSLTDGAGNRGEPKLDLDLDLHREATRRSWTLSSLRAIEWAETTLS